MHVLNGLHLVALSDKEVEALIYACGPGMEQCREDFKKTRERKYSLMLIALERLRSEFENLLRKEKKMEVLNGKFFLALTREEVGAIAYACPKGLEQCFEITDTETREMVKENLERLIQDFMRLLEI